MTDPTSNYRNTGGAGTANSTFPYKPLNRVTPEIRVLKLLPSPDLKDPIEAQLVARPLRSCSDTYEAVSYVWGVPEFIRQITLNGVPFFVTRTLDMALRYLRLPKSERILWVDALCINQNDVDERNQQVRLMRHIYAGCQADLVWMLSYQEFLETPPIHPAKKQKTESRLGALKRSLSSREDQQDAKVLKDMELIGDAIERTRHSATETKKIPVVDRLERSELTLEQCAMLAPFFNGSYVWYRVWTMQELSFAPQLIMVAGPHQINWNFISDFLGEGPSTDAFHAPFRHFLRSKDWNRTLGGALKVDEQRRILRDGTYNTTLLDVLARFQSNEASDPRDCIYGLLGLVTEEHSITIDYSKAVAQVFMDTTISLINSSHNLDVLCQTAWMAGAPSVSLAQDESNEHDLPSWVPNFSRQVKYTDHENILFAQRGIYNSGRHVFPAALDSDRVNGRYLPIKAVVLDTIASEVAEAAKRSIWGSGLNRAPGIWLKTSGVESDVFDKVTKYAPTGEPTLRAFWRTLFVDCTCYPIKRLTNEELDTGDKAFGTILDFSRKYHALLSEVNDDETDGSDSEDGMRNNPRAGEDETLARLWKNGIPDRMRDMWRRNYKNWFFTVTKNGLYAMVRLANLGDIIASVDGAKVPLVLRATKCEAGGRKVYSLVGTAYVHGFMDGAAHRDVARGTRSEEDFLLL